VWIHHSAVLRKLSSVSFYCALNALTVQASSIELGKLFQIFTMRAEKMLSVLKVRGLRLETSLCWLNKVKSKNKLPGLSILKLLLTVLSLD